VPQRSRSGSAVITASVKLAKGRARPRFRRCHAASGAVRQRARSHRRAEARRALATNRPLGSSGRVFAGTFGTGRERESVSEDLPDQRSAARGSGPASRLAAAPRASWFGDRRAGGRNGRTWRHGPDLGPGRPGSTGVARRRRDDRERVEQQRQDDDRIYSKSCCVRLGRFSHRRRRLWRDGRQPGRLSVVRRGPRWRGNWLLRGWRMGHGRCLCAVLSSRLPRMPAGDGEVGEVSEGVRVTCAHR
jgi:hypothetical protein